MIVEKTKWKYGKQAPVLLMIDDFTNKYMLDKKNGDYLGADWGGKCHDNNSFLEYLENTLLKRYPYIKTTLFCVVGQRENIIHNGKKCVNKSIADTPEFISLLKELENNPSYEIAYHGITHGKIIKDRLEQEWMVFKDLDDAVASIENGLSLYESVTGIRMNGGKYCGYQFNSFSDESIVRSGFQWWCRHYEGSMLFKKSSQEGLSLELETFGGVVDIPTTVDGNLFSLSCTKHIFTREYLKAIFYNLRYNITLEQILSTLIKNQNVISIQEHTSPIREDSKLQRPNIITDMPNLIYIFQYLQNYDLWYSTCSEVAAYYRVNQDVNVQYIDSKIIVTALSDIGDQKFVTIKIVSERTGRFLLLNGTTKIELKFEKYLYTFVELKAKRGGNIYLIKEVGNATKVN